MKCESEVLGHRWWHHLFTRKVGMWRDQELDEKSSMLVIITRIVRYCPLCRVDFHEGSSIKQDMRRALGRPENPLAAVKQFPGVVGLAPAPVLPVPEDDDGEVD
jgi:hypothetical protein